ncbi:hypothetical protein LOAG_18808 [Loa loa]|nr:hypothetical protein LOAG_18808 [Loa loa]EJD73795.1 hypothetical protein LOAG_18808 [Loa loa]
MAKGLKKKKYRDPEWTMGDTIKYLKEKMEIEESEVKLPEKGNLVDRTKMQRARSNGTRFANGGEWHQTFDSLLNSEGENISQQSDTKERGKSITVYFL